MDYKQKYIDAIERARQFSEHPLQEDSADIVEYIFPELVGSKDERIMRELCKAIWTYIPYEEAQEYIAWLEKQGEKSTIIDVDKMVMEYSQTKDGDFGLPVNCMIKAYKKGINDALKLSLNLEKQGEQKTLETQGNQVMSEIIKNQKEMPGEFTKLVHENFWDLTNAERKTLNADEVIAWLMANICDYEYYVEWFKRDFGL